VYSALLSLVRTPRLPVVDCTDAPADLNGFARFAERRNLVSARVPSHLNWPLPLSSRSRSARFLHWRHRNYGLQSRVYAAWSHGKPIPKICTTTTPLLQASGSCGSLITVDQDTTAPFLLVTFSKVLATLCKTTPYFQELT
jgi:hypothetical protein